MPAQPVPAQGLLESPAGRRKELLKVNGMSLFPGALAALRGQLPVAFGVLKPGSAETASSLLARYIVERRS